MKKIFLVLFSLIMMCSVSFAIEPNVEYKAYNYGISSTSANFGTYTGSEVNRILQNYYSDSENESYKLAFDTLIEYVESLGHKYVVYRCSSYYCLMVNDLNYPDVKFVRYPNNANGDEYFMGMYYLTDTSINLGKLFGYGSSGSVCSYGVSSAYNIASSNCNIGYNPYGVIKSNVDIYDFTYSAGSNPYTVYWDGESYYYEVPKTDSDDEGAEVPELTDEEIAEIVTRFVNSDAYLTNNKNEYNDFFITYNKLTKYYRAYTYHENMDLAISYGNYNGDGEFVTTGTEEGEAWQIRPYVFDGNIFRKLYDWLSSKYNNVSFAYYSISPDSTINPRYVGDLEYSYCSDYRENEFVVYSTKQIRFLGEETNSEGETETIVIDDYIPKTVLINSETGEEIVIENNMQDSSNSLENIITPNADFSGLKDAFEKYISFVNISSITWLTTAISSMITIFVPFVALGIILFLINRILNGGS